MVTAADIRFICAISNINNAPSELSINDDLREDASTWVLGGKAIIV